jgi:membrane protease YdiL (CAAX protease family)
MSASLPAKAKPEPPFSPAPAAGWLPWGLLAPFLAIAFVLVPVLATIDPMERFQLLDSRGDPIGSTGLIALLFIPFTLTGLLALAWTAFVERRPLATIGLAGPGAAGRFLRGALIGIATIFGVTVAIWAAGGLDAAAYGPAFANPAALLAIGILLLGFVVQSSVEEILFRGWLLSVAARKFNVAIAVLMNCIVFAFLHFTPGQPWLVTLNLVLFSLFACCWALNAGSIWGVMGWHAGWNWLLATGFELPLTGIDADLPALLVALRANGPDYLTGGAQGPEGSIFSSLFFVGGIAFVLWRTRARSPAHGRRRAE